MTPEALRRRLAHGNVYPPQRIDAGAQQLLPPRQPRCPPGAGPAVGGRPGRRVAQGVPGGPSDRGTGERERIVVAMTGAPGTDELIRRAARMAGRLRADLVGVHVSAGTGLAEPVGHHGRVPDPGPRPGWPVPRTGRRRSRPLDCRVRPLGAGHPGRARRDPRAHVEVASHRRRHRVAGHQRHRRARDGDGRRATVGVGQRSRAGPAPGVQAEPAPPGGRLRYRCARDSLR